MSKSTRLMLIGLTVAMAASFAAGFAIAAQPHMQNALRALRNAKAELETATPDKAGHRVKAIGLVDQAIAEVNAGIVAGQ
jgi:HAMP domain-containing protein